jgi:isopenicillin-N N-acyltransferase-like protein
LYATLRTTLNFKKIKIIMKHLKRYFFAAFLLTVWCNSYSQQPAVKIGTPKNVPVIELQGNGYQRGLQHGKLLKTEIAELYKKWKKDIETTTKQNADTLIDHFFHSTNFEPAIKKWTPEIYDEIKGLAKSSGQTFKDVYCFQMADEFWVYLDKIKNKEANHCSGIGVAANGSNPSYIAQNLDAESFMNGSQVLLHIKAYKNEPEQYVLSSAGLVGMNGINSNGIGVTVNTLMELTASTDGLPVACVVRGILLKKDKKSALDFLQKVKHASGQNYIIGDGDSVYDFEASANKVVRFIPVANNPSLVYHTNHAMSNDDIKPWYKELNRKISSGESDGYGSVTRFTALKNRLDISNTDFSDKTIKETLSSKDNEKYPVCIAYQSDKYLFTFSSVIYTLGKNPTVQLTNGSPDQSAYVLHKFTSNK